MAKNEDSIVNQDSLDFGARLKFIREYNGLSQRELAKRAGVPHSSISMIEQGLNSPSVNSLSKILAGIPMSIAHFFSCDITQLKDQIFRVAELQAHQKKISDSVIVQSIPIQNPSSITRFEKVFYSAGSDTGEAPLYSAQAVSGFIVSGSIELTLNSEVSLLAMGDAFSLAAMQPYRLRNLSANEDCVIATCIT
ncbi:MAG: helix-turn-helix domain-containing protein [Gammaproteobacteria bacterium]|nr:MAG: helix-turn-helix domain-containing protein [Gammaproteobacteria bacterium]